MNTRNINIAILSETKKKGKVKRYYTHYTSRVDKSKLLNVNAKSKKRKMLGSNKWKYEEE